MGMVISGNEEMNVDLNKISSLEG